jgi:hypothetical protein
MTAEDHLRVHAGAAPGHSGRNADDGGRETGGLDRAQVRDQGERAVDGPADPTGQPSRRQRAQRRVARQRERPRRDDRRNGRYPELGEVGGHRLGRIEGEPEPEAQPQSEDDAGEQR